MLLVGLTGGIGSGKSTVARMLAERGAVVFDADYLARRAVEPGTPGHAAVIRRFGAEVLAPEGGIDREGLARLVFRDEQARSELENIVHPEVARLFQEAIDPFRETNRIVVYVVPLLVEAGLAPAFDVVVSVTAPEDLRIARVAASRRMDEEDVRARISAQAPDEERERAADHVIANDGDLDALERKVDGLWAELQRKARSAGHS
jgi:dephospho-CoA kinase